MSSTEAAARTIKWHQVREAVLGTPSGGTGEKISKVSGEVGPVVDRRKAERALQQLQAELLQHDQRRDEDEAKIADAVRQVTQLNQQLDALSQDLERMKTFSREQQSQIEGGLTLRVISDAAAPFRYRLQEVAGTESKDRTEIESPWWMSTMFHSLMPRSTLQMSLCLGRRSGAL